jgi:hypothetical protein
VEWRGEPFDRAGRACQANISSSGASITLEAVIPIRLFSRLSSQIPRSMEAIHLESDDETADIRGRWITEHEDRRD